MRGSHGWLSCFPSLRSSARTGRESPMGSANLSAPSSFPGTAKHLIYFYLRFLKGNTEPAVYCSFNDRVANWRTLRTLPTGAIVVRRQRTSTSSECSMLRYTRRLKEALCQRIVLNMKRILNTVHARAWSVRAAATAANASRLTCRGNPCRHVRGILLDPRTDPS